MTQQTAARLALVDDYARQQVPRGMVTCLGGDAKELIIKAMEAEGLLRRLNPNINYNVRRYEVTTAGWEWVSARRHL